MKKLFIILSMLVYGLSSSGMTISLHFCCGKLDGISLTGKQEDNCKMGNHQKKSGCCNDQQISASLTTDQQAANKWVHSAKQTIVAAAYNEIASAGYDYIVSNDNYQNNTLFLPAKIPLFIKNCVFRI